MSPTLAELGISISENHTIEGGTEGIILTDFGARQLTRRFASRRHPNTFQRGSEVKILSEIPNIGTTHPCVGIELFGEKGEVKEYAYVNVDPWFKRIDPPTPSV